MVRDSIYSRFLECVGAEAVMIDEPMKNHTTFKIGGPADYIVSPHSAEELQKVVAICQAQGVAYYVIGNGSNLLVSDAGVKGVVIQIYRNMNEITVEDDVISAQSGILLSQLGKAALDHELTGLEFASGIPGTLGGAVVMNAGAYGGEMKDVLEEVTVLTHAGEILYIAKENLQLGYRTSIVKEKNYIVLGARMRLKHGRQEEIRHCMQELKGRRISKQPLDYPSAGSTFKRPPGQFAGKLIMDAGLAGFQVGGARVSEKHCGFVINQGGATASDVVELIRVVKEKVKADTGIELEPEVQFLGEFEEKR